jgi:hypothetical protein
MTSTSVASKQAFALFLLVLLLSDARVPGGDHVKAHLPWRHYIMPALLLASGTKSCYNCVQTTLWNVNAVTCSAVQLAVK